MRPSLAMHLRGIGLGALGLFLAAQQAAARPEGILPAAGFAEAARELSAARSTAPERLALAERRFAEARSLLAERLERDYVARHLRIGTRILRRHDGSSRICPEIANTGPLAVRFVTLGLRLRGQDVPEAVLEAATRLRARSLELYPFVRSRDAARAVQGIPPGTTWRGGEAGEIACMEASDLTVIRPSEAFASFGGLPRGPRDWALTIRRAALSRSDARILREAPDEFAYRELPREEVFAEELARAERAALRRGHPATRN